MKTFFTFLALMGVAQAETYQDPKAAAYYAEHKEFFHFAAPGDLPKNLVWHDGAEQKEFAEPRAIRGGNLRQFTASTPPTMRRVGPTPTTGSAASFTTTTISDYWPPTPTPTNPSRRSPCSGRCRPMR